MRNYVAVGLFVAAVIAAMYAGLVMTAAKSAVHEIEALICALIAVCGFGMGALILAVEKLREDTVTAVNRGTQVAINEAKLAEVKK